MKVNRSPDVRRILPLKRSAAAGVIDLFASVTFAVAVILRIAAARATGPDFAVDPLLSAGKAVA